MGKYMVEMIGTFFFVLTIGMTVIAPGAGPLAPLAIGSALMVMVYAGGHVSGGHYNPAVTLAVWLRGKCATSVVPGYMVMQVVGAVLAAIVVGVLKGPDAMAQVTAAPRLVVPTLLAEFLFTFALAWVVLNSATARGTTGNSFYGLAIGFTVVIGAFSVGNVSGAALNPAIVVGALAMKLVTVGNLWIYFVAELAGGAVAALTFKAINPEDV
jgi:aquaporin Z